MSQISAFYFASASIWWKKTVYTSGNGLFTPQSKCEGMIPIRDLDDDYYEFDEKNYCLRGRRKHRVYSLGY
jgi:exoribonuclease R